MAKKNNITPKGRAGDVPVYCAHDAVVSLDELKPNPQNPNKHGTDQVQRLATILRKAGWRAPITVSKRSGFIVKGHGRMMAAQVAGFTHAPVDYQDYATEADELADLMADNYIAELSETDTEMAAAILACINDSDTPLENSGYTDEEMRALLSAFNFGDEKKNGSGEDWFENRERYDNSGLDEESEEYQDFVDKFEQKKTTDDCYTPDGVYDAVAGYVERRYGVSRDRFVRPFYPGGDYQAAKYPAGCVVVDNPPFSILSEITNFYQQHGVRFFLFAPTLTLLSSAYSSGCAAICVGVGVTYEDGANVNTSFVTNLESEDIQAKTDHELYEVVKAANDEELRKIHTQQRKYEYPDNIVTSAMLAKFSKYGAEFTARKADCVRVGALDAQKQTDDTIYGGGLLLAEKAAAEKAAAERWTLSDRERKIIDALGKGGRDAALREMERSKK